MLILPWIEKAITAGKRRVRWTGFLTDWELAKYVPKDKSLQRARQPERTVRVLCSLVLHFGLVLI